MSSEEQLIHRARTDPRAFGELYDRYYPKVFGYVYRVTADYALACDITSETFLKAWIKLGSFQWKGISISSWFFRIATNEINQYFRRGKYTPRSISELSLSGLIAQTALPVHRMEQEEEFRQLHHLLSKLPPAYHTIIVLRYFEGLDIRNIAQILGKKEVTVRSLLFRGLEKLKKLMCGPATQDPR